MAMTAGVAGVAGGLAGLFGGSSMPSAPPQFIMPNMGQAANNAFAGIQGLAPYTSQAGSALSPTQQTFSNLYSNPYAGAMQTGANFASPFGQNAALTSYGTGSSWNTAGLGTQPVAGQLLNTAFDPQNALYNRTAQQVQDQTLAGLEATGMGTTPYGAGVLGQTMANFNIDWQNNLLNRETQGAGAAGGLLTQGANLSGLGTGLMNAAPGQYLQASAMPYSTFGQIGGDQNAAIQAMLGNTGTAQNVANVPVQDYLAYLQAGNSANSVANQNYLAQLTAQNNQFNQQLRLGGMIGLGMYGMGQGINGLSSGTGSFLGYNPNAYGGAGSFLGYSLSPSFNIG